MKRIIIALTCTLIATAALAQTGHWTGKLDAGGATVSLIFHLGDSTATLDVPDMGAKGIPVSVKRMATGQIELGIPAINASYKGVWTGKLISGTYTQHGMSFPMPLTPGVPTLKRPQTPVGPFVYVNADVTFSNGDAVLKGTLTTPKNCTRETPVLIMVTGSGFQNRDEEIFEHKPFAVIADAFAKAGIATLRYDDRGFGESTGDVISCTTEDLKNDALAGIRLLRERFDHVGVLGHSEGGSIALMLAAEGQADFVISLAGMIISGAETLLEQNRHALQMAGMSEADVNSYCRFLSDAFNAAVHNSPYPSLEDYYLPAGLKQNAGTVINSLGTPYMKYFLGMNVSEMLHSVTCPVMALNGTKDTQVDCERNLEALRKGLPTDAGDNSTIRNDGIADRETGRTSDVKAGSSSGEQQTVVIEAKEGLNHLFQHCTTGELNEYKEIEETFAPEVLTEMIAWIQSVARGR